MKQEVFCRTQGLISSTLLVIQDRCSVSVDPNDWVEDLRELDLAAQELPAGRVLGVYWDIEVDVFSFKSEVPSKEWTKRTMLSAISSLFDPLGLVLPFVVSARSLFQQVCQLQLGWDDKLPVGFVNLWQEWLCTLPLLAR